LLASKKPIFEIHAYTRIFVLLLPSHYRPSNLLLDIHVAGRADLMKVHNFKLPEELADSASAAKAVDAECNHNGVRAEYIQDDESDATFCIYKSAECIQPAFIDLVLFAMPTEEIHITQFCALVCFSRIILQKTEWHTIIAHNY